MYHYVRKNNDSYHKYDKEYTLLYDSFDVSFSSNGTRLTTP